MAEDMTLEQNKSIEEAIVQLQQTPSDEMLAHALTVIRRSMKQQAQVIVAVDSNPATDSLSMRTISTENNKQWFYAFTSYDEQFKGGQTVLSGFTSELYKLFAMVLQTDDVDGLILNPWNRTIMLDKQLIRIILGMEQ